MRKSYVVAIAAVVVLTTLGVPAHAVEMRPKVRDGRLAIAGEALPGRALSKDLRLPWRANMIGVSFDAADPHDVTVQVRARRGDAWLGWTELHADPDEAAEGAEARKADPQTFTHPLWLGTADRVQLRVSTAHREPVRGVRVHFFNSLGDAEPVGVLTRVRRTLGALLTAQPASSAQAAAPTPDIISRAEWGADESIGDSGPGSAPYLKMAFVHHTVNSNSYAKSESDNLVRAIHRYHVLSRDYSDIGYNFLVDRYGQVFEGRKGGVTRAVIGAHTLGFNRYSTGISLIGDFRTAVPPKGMRSALARLIAWKFDVHHIPVLGKVAMVSAGNDKYDSGERVSFNRVSGHRDGTSTTCPGYETYRRLSSIRDAADAIGHPKIYLPKISSTVLRPDGDSARESVSVSATFSRSVSYALRFSDSSGNVRRTFRGTGTSVSAVWNGTDADGKLLNTGRYKWRLDAIRSGVKARAAYGYVSLIKTHPNGTLLRDRVGTYVRDVSTARAVGSVVQASVFGTLPPTSTGPSERARYSAGTALGLRPGTLLEGPDGARYILSGGKLRRFAALADGTDTFTALGYDPAALIRADATSLASVPVGTPVTDVTRHPDDTVIKDEASGQKWVLHSGTRRSLTTLARRSRYRAAEVVSPTSADMLLPLGAVYPPRSGALVRDPAGGAPWLISSAKKRRFVSWGFYYAHGFTDAMLLSTSSADLAAVATGPTYT